MTVSAGQRFVDLCCLVDELTDDDGDVVISAGLERQPDQLGCGEVNGLGAQCHLDDVVADHVGETVAAQEVAVAFHRLQPVVVGLVVIATEQGAQQQRAVRVHAGFVTGDLAFVDQALDERVVGADLLERAVTETVCAGVAEVGESELGAVPDHRLQRRAHALDCGISGDQVAEAGVGADNGLFELGHRVAVEITIELPDDVHRLGGGDVTGGSATHTVGEHQQAAAGVGGVLVGGSAQTGIGQGDIAIGK